MKTINKFISEKLKLNKQSKLGNTFSQYTLSYNDFLDKLFNDFKYLGKLNLPMKTIDNYEDSIIMKLADIFHRLPSKIEKTINVINLNEIPVNDLDDELKRVLRTCYSSTIDYGNMNTTRHRRISKDYDNKLYIWLEIFSKEDNIWEKDYNILMIEYNRRKFIFLLQDENIKQNY